MSVDLLPDRLEERLENLVVESPDAGRVAARVLSRAQRPPARRLPRVAALSFVSVALVVLIAYFVPAADVALADAPIAGDLLRDAGLVGAAGRITAVGAVADSSGYRLKLVGAYADSTRTVLLLQAAPAILPLGFGTELTDQFGRTYQMQGGTSNSLTGDVVAQFEALAWPDAFTGARITLHVSSVHGACQSAVQCAQPQSPADGPPVSGSWSLPAILGVDEGTVLEVPAAGHLGQATYRFISVRSTPATIAVELEVTGMSFGELQRTYASGGKFAPYSTIELLGPNGEIVSGSGDESEDIWGVHLHFLWNRETPGDYRLHIAYLGTGDLYRVIHVP